VDASPAAIGVLAASVAVKLYMCSYNRAIGRRIDSTAMRATAADSLSDAAATLMVLFGMLIMRYTGIYVDGWCGVLVALFIFYTGYTAARDTLSPLLGQPPKQELIDEIYAITLAHKKILGIHDLVVHDYGPGRLMISLHGEVSGDGNIFALHDVIDQAEKELKERLGCEAVIHMDPIETANEESAAIRRGVEEIVKQIHSDITIHDFRMTAGEDQLEMAFDAVAPYQTERSDEELAEEIKRRVSEKWEGCRAEVSIDHEYVL